MKTKYIQIRGFTPLAIDRLVEGYIRKDMVHFALGVLTVISIYALSRYIYSIIH